MAYMHESVHICHVESPFLMQLPFSVSYPGSFVIVRLALVPIYEMLINLEHGNAPEEGESDKKILKKILKKIFLRRKNSEKYFLTWKKFKVEIIV